MPPIHPPAPPCDEARRWLLDDPTGLGSEIGQMRRNPEHWPRALNPVLPVDVPFDIPPTWAGAVPNPQPIVVLGPFLDTRVETYAGDAYFVVDALVWTRDRPSGPLDTLTALTPAATEDAAAVLARVEAASGTPFATWTTVVDPADFARLDPRAAESMPEFTRGAPVWVVRRLIETETDGRQRLAVESAFTHDHGDRIWLTPTPDSSPELLTTFDLRLPSGSANDAGTLKIVDEVDQVASARIGDHSGVQSWRTIGPEGYTMRVGSTSDPRDLVIEWKRPDCVAAWRLDITAGLWIGFSASSDVGCRGRTPTYVIVEFDQPIDLRAVHTDDVLGGG